MNTISCRYCKGANVVELFPAKDIMDNDWSIFQCKDCKAYFLAPEPTITQLSQAYDASYYGEGKRKFVPSVEKFIDYFRSKKARYLSKRISSYSKVLDIGCGNGRFLQYLSSFGDYELHGLELEGGSADRAKEIKKINLKIGTLQQGDYSKEYFDAITLFHVFEHLAQPKETFDIIKNILKKDGLLMMSFPNIAGWQATTFKGKWYHLDPPRHLFFFDPDDLIKIMENNGFILIRKHWFSFEQNPYGWVQSFLNVMCKKREVLYERLKGNISYAQQYSKINIFFQKLFFVFTIPLFVIIDFIESLFGKSATVMLTFKKK